MQKWEQRIVICDVGTYQSDVMEAKANDLLSRLGAEGWELVSHAPHKLWSNGENVVAWSFTFKRPRA